MVWSGLSSSDDLVAHPAGEGDIDQMVAMDVSQLTLPQPIFSPTKTVWARADTLPA